MRPRGPFTYTFNCSPNDDEPKNPNGSGVFYATIPGGSEERRHESAERRQKQPASLRVEVNGEEGRRRVNVPVGEDDHDPHADPAAARPTSACATPAGKN